MPMLFQPCIPIQVGLDSVIISKNLQSSLMQTAKYGNYLLKVYDKVQAVSGFIDLLNTAREIFGQATVFTPNDSKRSGIPKGVDFKAAVKVQVFICLSQLVRD